MPRNVFNGRKLTDVDISVEKVRKLIKSIKAHSSAGPDRVHPRVLWECADVIAEPIHKIFEESLKTGCLPSDW